MRSAVQIMIALAALSFTMAPSLAAAQDTEEKFHDLFITAGYATAFGAALGTAILGLAPNPAENLQYIYAGASLGFIGGSILGSYVIFSPMFSNNRDLIGAETAVASSNTKKLTIKIKALFDPDSRDLIGGGAIWNIATF